MSEPDNVFEKINDAIQSIRGDHDERLRELERKAGRPSIGGNGGNRLAISDDARAEFKAQLLGKSMNGINAPDGGYLVPTDINTSVTALIERQSPLRQVANVVDVTSPNTNFPVALRGTGSGWVGEQDERPETNAPKLANVSLPGGTIYALPTVTEELVEDAIIDIEAFLRTSVADEIAARESAAFVSGDGVKKPLGFLSGAVPTKAGDDARPFGTIQYLPTGQASNLGDLHGNLTSMIYSLRPAYRQADGCAWVMSTDMLAQIQATKDGAGRPLYYPATSDAAPGTLLGYPVLEMEAMPAVAANSFPIAFGNWRRGYTIADRTPLSVLRDPYSYKGAVSWYFRKRVHGGVVNSEAIKLLKVAAS